jgi:hypothetical protein
VIFSNIFLPIFHNIELYIYTVKYKSGIKIPGFLQNISKKNSKHFQKEKIYFDAHGQILHCGSSPSTPSFSFSSFSSIGNSSTDSSTDATTSFKVTTRTPPTSL